MNIFFFTSLFHISVHLFSVSVIGVKLFFDMDGLLIGGSESEDRIKGRFLNSPSNQSVPGLIAIIL